MFILKTGKYYQEFLVKKCKIFLFSFLIVFSAPWTATAGTVEVDFGSLDFSSSGQGMWGSGSAPGLNIDRFLGVTWNETATVGGITGEISSTSISWPHPHSPSGWQCHGFACLGGHFHNSGGIHIHTNTLSIDTRTGATLDISTSGKVGFQFGLQADSGSVNTDVQFNANVFFPEPGNLRFGEFFNLNPDSSLAGGTLSTNFPELTVNLDAIVGVRARVDNAQACLALVGCTAKASTGELGFADQTVPIISFNDPGSPGEIKILGLLDPALFQFDSEISIPGAVPGSSLGGVTVHVPDINAIGGVSGNKLVASGEDDLIKLTADLDGLALAPLGLPGGGVSFNVGILSVSADLIDIDMGPILKIVQDFEFTPSLIVDLLFDKPVLIAGLFGPQTSWSGLWDSLPDIALLSPNTLITPTFSVEGMFSNNTLLGIDGIFQLDILKASLALEALGFSFDLGEIGPLFQILERTNLFNTPPLFSSTFALSGFNNVVGRSFMITVPEPTAILLLGFGLIVVGVRRRKLI